MNTYTATIQMGISKKTGLPVELELRAKAEDEERAIDLMLAEIKSSLKKMIRCQLILEKATA